jgi:hypothetical protein
VLFLERNAKAHWLNLAGNVSLGTNATGASFSRPPNCGALVAAARASANGPGVLTLTVVF